MCVLTDVRVEERARACSPLHSTAEPVSHSLVRACAGSREKLHAALRECRWHVQGVPLCCRLPGRQERRRFASGFRFPLSSILFSPARGPFEEPPRVQGSSYYRRARSLIVVPRKLPFFAEKSFFRAIAFYRLLSDCSSNSSFLHRLRMIGYWIRMGAITRQKP